jgi:DNA-binding transcriptional ArsR family regulator
MNDKTGFIKASEIDGNDEMLFFFKALANVERLKIMGLLALKAYTIAELAAALNLKPALAARHVAYLAEIDLIKEDAGSYRVDEATIQALSRRVLENSRPRVSPDDFEGEASERKVLSDFFTADNQLKAFPMQQKKLLVILRRLAQAFEIGPRYTEKQVNDILRPFNPDTAAQRRYLVDNGLLHRAQGVYWKE